jgi:hypothetical protein
VPTTVNCLSLGTTPAGVTWPPGRHQRDLVARLHEHRARQLDAEHDAELARHQLVEGALSGNAVGVGDLGFELGVDAAHDRAASCLHRRAISACAST